MSHDSFCALCGGPWHANIRDSAPEGSDDDDNMDEDIDGGYSPRKITEKEIDWLGDFRGIGYNPNPSVQKYFVTSLAEETDLGNFEVDRDDDPALSGLPGQDEDSILSFEPYQDAIPIHDLCLSQILPRVLYHTDPRVKALETQPLDWVNKEILYKSMFEVLRGSGPGLDLNYYEVQLAIQLSVWIEEPGFEPLAADPVDVPGLQEYYENLPQLVKASTIDIKEPVRQKSSCFRSDPFALLPHEMILEVFSHLPIESVVAFQIASRAANIFLSNETWRRRIQSDMPWLWDLFEDHAPRSDVCKTTIDWKKVYAFMECSSRFESCDHICGLVNRRRIWKICSQIAVLYASKTASQKPPKSRNEDVSENISSKTRCSLVARISKVREPNETRFTTFMLLGLGDLHHGSCVLRTYWNDDERLTGVSMTMKGRSPRLFGHETSAERNVKSIVIEEGDWVQKLTLTLDYCGIKALKVTTVKFMSFSLGDSKSSMKRRLRVRQGMVFAGLKGETLRGVISGIGLLEIAENDETELVPIPLADQLLWYEPNHELSVSHNDEIIAHPFDPGAWRFKDSIGFQGMVTHDFHAAFTSSRTITSLSVHPDLQDIGVYHEEKAWSFHSPPTFCRESQMKWFPIDGKQGERIVGLEVEVMTLPSSFRVVTNRGRQMTFGSPTNAARRHTYVPGPGHCVAGIYTSKNHLHSKGAEKRMNILSMLSVPGVNESHLMRPAERDENGLIWESDSPPSDWMPMGSVRGCSEAATIVTWLDLTKHFSQVEGLVGAPLNVDLLDLDGIRLLPVETSLKPTKDDRMKLIEAQGAAISIGTPPVRSSLLHDKAISPACRGYCWGYVDYTGYEGQRSSGAIPHARCKGTKDQIIPACEKFGYSVKDSGYPVYESDKADGAIPHVKLTYWPHLPDIRGGTGEDAATLETEWPIPGHKIRRVTIWSGTYLHGFQFHGRSGEDSPKWGKCGGSPSARWTVDAIPGPGPSRCIGLKFFLGNFRGHRGSGDVKIIGIQRMVKKATDATKNPL